MLESLSESFLWKEMRTWVRREAEGRKEEKCKTHCTEPTTCIRFGDLPSHT